ncbi:ParB N-terminal domain-containing protein [Verrucomicrobiota bacterium]
MNRELIDIDIDKIVVKSHIRQDIGDLSTLEKSIQKAGMLYPIIIDRNNVLISGKRRVEACRNISLTKISAFRLDIDATSMTALDIQSDENLCRQPLSNEELEKHIQMKKEIMSGKTSQSGTGIFARIKNMFK